MTTEADRAVRSIMEELSRPGPVGFDPAALEQWPTSQRCAQCIALSSLLETEARHARRVTVAFFCLIALYAGVAGMLFWILRKVGG